MASFVHQVAYATDMGIGSLAAASSISLMALSGLAGQFGFGWMSDHLSDPKYASCAGFSSMLAGTLVLVTTNNVWGFYTYCLLFGFGYGSFSPLMAILSADRFGRQNIGAAYGLLTFFIGLGGGLGPVLGGVIFDRFGSYTYLWYVNILILTAVSVLILRLKRDG